jgi:hypothetical protein
VSRVFDDIELPVPMFKRPEIVFIKPRDILRARTVPPEEHAESACEVKGIATLRCNYPIK